MEFNPKKKDKLSVGTSLMQQASRKELIGRVALQRGQKMFELNTVTGVIKLAEFKESTIEFPTAHNEANIRRELKPNPNCIYRVALNMPNAKKKFKKYIDRKNNIGDGKIIWADCPKCEAEKIIEITLTKSGENILAHIMPCYCGYQGTTIEDFIPKPKKNDE